MGVHDKERKPGQCGNEPKCPRSGLVGAELQSSGEGLLGANITTPLTAIG